MLSYHLMQVNSHIHKQTHNRELSSLTVSPRCITLSGMLGEVRLSRHSSMLGRRRACDVVFLPPEMVAEKIVCVTHLDLSGALIIRPLKSSLMLPRKSSTQEQILKHLHLTTVKNERVAFQT